MVETRRQGVTYSTLRSALPPRFTFSERLTDFSTEDNQALLVGPLKGRTTDVVERVSGTFGELTGRASAFDITDGLPITFVSRDTIPLRPSGISPGLRGHTKSATRQRRNFT